MQLRHSGDNAHMPHTSAGPPVKALGATVGVAFVAVEGAVARIAARASVLGCMLAASVGK